MKKLSKFVSEIEASNEEPLSFSFHCEVGRIIVSNDSEINTTNVDEKVAPPQELIPFIP